uniref:trigger factor n=1 Tax=Ndongobacter massiliensis TaxID=1871025 RepID=UPI000931CF9F|nr:trigger factor [Ndongobacter massiliensis]
MKAVLISHENDKAVYTTEVAYETFEQAVDAVYHRTKARYRVPGFRKGHAPKKIIEANYGKGVFYEDALNEVLPAAMDDAVKELGLEPIGRPDVDVKEFEEGKPIVFELTTETKPHPEIGDISKIEVTKQEAKVTEEQVDQRVNQEREKNSVLRPVERPAQDGDEATIDFEGFLNDKPFKGGKAEKHKLVLGSHTFIPGFEEQLIGHSAGEEFDIQVTFPEDYQAKELKGKEARFHIVLHTVSEKEVPEADDDFAQDVSEFDTLAEYRDSIRADLQKALDQQVKVAQQTEAIDKIVEQAGVTAPEAMVEEQISRELENIANQVAQMGMSFDQYLKYAGGDLEALRKQHRPQAERQVKADLVMDALVEQFQPEVTDEELEEELHRMASVYGAHDADDFIKRVKELGNEERVRDNVKVQKALDRLMETVTYVDAPEKPEEESSPETKSEDAPTAEEN